MAVKLSIRLEDAKGDLLEMQDNARGFGESVRAREIEQSIRAVEEAIELFKELETAAPGMRELLHYVRD